ncbi:hypothetical protein ALQ33_200175 [Pseudomonas syringae pv. philadelphi]|uniref:Uncharacterized protein n=1 Tax=Pseudomonas syringae pv. philadelphi TaxID=251706 RepID=A0A3M3YBL1_9PSED|nr:hypothetical protein ALQ33_200175 [Pseudomonas syringae pv. philadelphi]
MQRQEKMDKAAAKLSRARSVLSLATKAGMEATRGELLDMIAAAMDCIDDADAVLQEEETQRQAQEQIQRGHQAPVVSCLELVPNHCRVVPLPTAISAS